MRIRVLLVAIFSSEISFAIDKSKVTVPFMDSPPLTLIEGLFILISFIIISFLYIILIEYLDKNEKQVFKFLDFLEKCWDKLFYRFKRKYSLEIGHSYQVKGGYQFLLILRRLHKYHEYKYSFPNPDDNEVVLITRVK